MADEALLVTAMIHQGQGDHVAGNCIADNELSASLVNTTTEGYALTRLPVCVKDNTRQTLT